MYTLALILGTSVSTLGVFGTLQECNTEVLNLRSQDVKAICVKQPSPEESLQKILQIIQNMQKNLEK